jgi:hypothetical protein
MRAGKWSDLVASMTRWVPWRRDQTRQEPAPVLEPELAPRQGGLPAAPKPAGERTSVVAVRCAKTSMLTDSERLAELATKVRSAIDQQIAGRIDEFVADPFSSPFSVIELETGAHFGTSFESAIAVGGRSADPSDVDLIRRIIGAGRPAEKKLQQELERHLREAFAPKYEITVDNRARGTKFSDMEETDWEDTRELSIQLQPSDASERAVIAARQAQKIAALEPELHEGLKVVLGSKPMSEVRVLDVWQTHDYDYVVGVGSGHLDIAYGSSSSATLDVAQAIIDNTRPDLRTAYEETVRRALPKDRELTGFEVRDGALYACLAPPAVAPSPASDVSRA